MVKAEAAEKRLNKMGSEVSIDPSFETSLCLTTRPEQKSSPTDQLAGPVNRRNATTRHGDSV